jgi:stage II sporulation protein AB (anti-sigma F factor)
MEKICNQMKLELLSKPENIGLARLTVASFAAQLDFTLEDIEEIKVVVSEAVSNAVLHGYAQQEGIVRIEATLYPERLELVVEDQGSGIEDVPQAREPAYTTSPDRMGLGFTFMESFMDRVEIQSEPNQGTRVWMQKSLEGKEPEV